MSNSILLSNGLFRVFVGATVTLLIVIVLTSVAITTTLSSPLTRFTPDPPPPSTTLGSSTTTVTVTSASTTITSITSTTTGATTTPTPTLTITCPSMVMVELGASLEPVDTGGGPVVTGGCGTPSSPIISYSDSVQSMTRKKRHESRNVPTPVVATVDYGIGIEVSGSMYDARSPSFSVANAQVSGTFTLDDTSVTSDPSVAVGTDFVLHAVNDPADGIRIYVSPDKNNLNAGRVYFTLRELSPDVNCSSNTTNGEPQVVWDHSAQRWLATERAGNVLCIYVSNSSDPLLSNWRLLTYYFATEEPERVSLAVWSEYAYSFSIKAGKLCVLDRTQVLNLSYDENTTMPTLFCAPSFDWPTKTWSPVHCPSEIPPLATASSNTNIALGSAVFIRPVDDELDSGANTPANDQLSIEHWYNVNFTTSTYQRNRYVVQLPDFRANTGNVSTPTAYVLDPSNVPRIIYRWLPLRAQQSIVGAFTINADTPTVASFWFELRWFSPSMFILPAWTVYQTGNVSHAWLPSATMDGGGTIGLTYTLGNATVYPSLHFATRLGNDPLGEMRDSIVLHDGQVGSVLTSNAWSRNTAVEPDPGITRIFYAAGARSVIMSPFQETLSRVRIQTEVIARNWTAFTYCPGESVSCIQLIEAS